MEEKEFIDYLIEFCKRRSITAYELSKTTGVSQTYCYKLLKGEMKNPSLKIVRLISVTMNLNYEEFLNNTTLY